MSISWLQISDLHITTNSSDINIMFDQYKDIANKCAPDFLIVTGDYCHFRKYRKYDRASVTLDKILNILKIDKNNVFLVPGNHDVRNEDFNDTDIDRRDSCINEIISNLDNADFYQKYMQGPPDDLRNAFKTYTVFIRNFYGNSINDNDVRLQHPCDVMCIKWNNIVNIILINTALISKNDKGEVFDILTLTSDSFISQVDTSLPSIVIGHHSIEDLIPSQNSRIPHVFKMLNVKAYLCGDKHKLDNKGIKKLNVPNTSIPMYVCGKSIPDTTDTYSDISLIHYYSSNEENSTIYVQPYIWNREEHAFKECNMFDIGIQKESFPLNESTHKNLPAPKMSYSNISTATFKIQIGDIISFGNINNMPIYWEIIDIQNDNILMLCNHGIAYMPFEPNAQSEPNWDNCYIHKWLNTYFKNSYLTSTVQDKSGKIFKRENILNDIFLLSTKEYEKYIQNNVDFKKINMHPSISMRGIYNVDGYVQWLLSSNAKQKNFVATVRPNGKIDLIGTASDIKHAIRPALWIKNI